MTDPQHSAVLDVVLALIVRSRFTAWPDLTPDTVLGDLPGLDSLQQLEAVALAEQHFGVEINTERLETIMTIGDIVDAISAAQRATSG